LFPDLSWSEVDVAAPAGPDIHAGELAADETFTDRSRHVALFYQGPRQYLPALSSVVAAARKRGDALFIAVPAHKVPLVRGMLGAGSANVTMADMTELGRNPARIIPALLTYAGEHRGQRVCCIAEPAWPGRTAAELLEAAKHEALVNLAFQDSPVTIICPYDTEGLPAAVIDDAVSTHPVFIENRQERASDRYLGPDLPSRCTGALPRPPADAEALGYRDDLHPVRSFITSRAERAGLTPDRIHDLVLAISELAANTLYHADGGGTVQVWQAGEEIICQVADAGQITDPLARHRLPPHDLLNGHGLWLVNKVCDLVQARTGRTGTTTRLHMRLNRP
jgi:anti-sigma regulatory factor (Ser/Thr protein kinase)